MKTVFSFICKLFVSGLLAVSILCVFCFFYDNTPLAIEQPQRYTNYKFAPHTFWSSMTEGFGFGRTNNIGYNSSTDVSFTEPVIAFLGSSQTEAMQVRQSRNYVSLVQRLLSGDAVPDNDYPCLNLGISSHYFNVCVSKFSDLLDAFDNTPYVVIEARSLRYSEDTLDQILDEEFHDPYREKSALVNLMRHIPLVRTLTAQYNQLQNNQDTPSATPSDSPDYGVYEQKLRQVMEKLSLEASRKGVSVIIVYHNTVDITPENAPVRADDAQLLDIFRRCCEDNNLSFIDATDAFLAHYRETYQMPYGFSNTKPGVGHLNETGHRIIAELVYHQITELVRGQ